MLVLARLMRAAYRARPSRFFINRVYCPSYPCFSFVCFWNSKPRSLLKKWWNKHRVTQLSGSNLVLFVALPMRCEQVSLVVLVHPGNWQCSSRAIICFEKRESAFFSDNGLFFGLLRLDGHLEPLVALLIPFLLNIREFGVADAVNENVLFLLLLWFFF